MEQVEQKEYKYDFAISLGHFCSIATGIQINNCRFYSLPFDWLMSFSLEKIFYLIKNNFKDFLNIKFLILGDNKEVPEKNYPVKNTEYKITFSHDFLRSISDDFKEQLSSVIEKYNRRINRFYKIITRPCLFYRYVVNDEEGKKEIAWLNDNYEAFISYIKSYNSNSDIIFIINSDLKNFVRGNYNIIFVDKDENDTKCRTPFTKSQELLDTLNDIKPYITDEDKVLLNCNN